MPTTDFSTVEGIFTSFTPSDMLGGVTPNLGQFPNLAQGAQPSMFNSILDILQNTGRGTYTASDIIEAIGSLAKKGGAGFDLSQYIDWYSTKGPITSLGSNVDASMTYTGPDGQPAKISGLQEVVGKDFTLPQGVTPFDVSICVSRSPFFSPATRNCHLAEIMLNSMPSIVLSQLVPYMQVEFVSTKRSANELQAAGLMKFLLGAIPTNGNGQTPNAAMISAHQTGGNQNNPPTDEIDFVGMEIFTSPQTLVNPTPNVSVGSTGARYSDVIDPFRPFATLEHVTVSQVPRGAGREPWRYANVQLKIHDRGRLSDLAELIKPEIYSTVTVWLTHGWRAPDRPGENAYFDYVNNNMMCREAYSVINSNFSFDDFGQCTVTLQLIQKGVFELRDSKISDNNNDLAKQFQKLKQVQKLISEYRVKLKLNPIDGSDTILGLGKEIRAFQVLDAAEQGVMPNDLPNLQTQRAAIDQLRNILQHTSGINQTLVTSLINDLRSYVNNNHVDPTTKTVLSNGLDGRVTKTIHDMFEEAITGPDPFLLCAAKQTANPKSGIPADLIQAIESYNKASPNPNSKTSRHTAVSFAKLFSVFVIRNICSSETVDELQLFFYPLNAQCGPISGRSVAEFPIDMQMFLDQYRDQVVRTGGERITMTDFMALIRDGQFLDDRAIGYGMRAGYNVWDPKNPEAKLTNDQGGHNSFMSKWQQKYGPFQKPNIQMLIEVTHERVSTQGDCDVLTYLSYSAKDATTLPPAQALGKAFKKIMRIHIYDTQTDPYKPAAGFIGNVNGSDYIQVPPSAVDFSTHPDSAAYNTMLVQQIKNLAASAQTNYMADNGMTKIAAPTSNQQIKDVVSQTVPTIRFGTNGSTIIHAQLQTKNDTDLASHNILVSATTNNATHPNGKGDFGLPLRVIPAILNLTTLGNPLAQYGQHYFIDFQTGTTLDNMYACTGVTHTYTPGKFETTWQFAYADAYGVWEHPVSIETFTAQLAASVPNQK